MNKILSHKVLLSLGLFASIFAFSQQGHAGLGVGLIGSLQQDTWTGTATDLNSVEPSKNSSRVGALLWLPIFPTLSIRTGYLLETQEIDAKYSTGTSSFKLTNAVIPLNLQFDLPITSLYVFGGALYVANQSNDTSVTGSQKPGTDTRSNLGLGYSIFGLPLMNLALELEYQKGMNNISPLSTGLDLKVSSVDLNLVFKLGF